MLHVFRLRLIGLIACCAALTLGATAPHAQDNPRLAKDINTLEEERDSLCGTPVEAGTQVFFCGGKNHLWRTDGTEQGTFPLRDKDGQLVRFPQNLIASGGLLYFETDQLLWVSDGTPQGTHQLLDSDGNEIDADDPELWTDVNGELFLFRFNLIRNGSLTFLHELWKTDGGPAQLVKIFDPRLNPNDAVEINGELFFTNFDHQLWRSDGTEAGTTLIADLPGFNRSRDNNNLTDVNGTLFFSLETENDTFDLWKSDGTASGTVLIAENPAGRFFEILAFANGGGTLSFLADVGRDLEVWKSDGTTAGTQRVKFLPDTRERAFTVYNDEYYFTTREDELWKSDGTEAGTFPLFQGVASALRTPVVHAGLLFFSADDGAGLGHELWRTDGTPAGTLMVKNIAWQAKSSMPEFLAATRVGVLFQANKARRLGGPSLWISDGTAPGTKLVKDISQFTFGSFPSLLTEVDGAAYFVASRTRTPGGIFQQWELWKSDGSEAGTRVVANLIENRTTNGLPLGGEYSELAGFNQHLYFVGNDGSGWALWRSDGSASGPERLSDLLPGALVGTITELTVYEGHLYFFADDGSGPGLWRLAPNIDSATLVQGDLTAPYGLTILSGTLVFVSNGDELWRSSGQAGNTRRIKTLDLGSDPVIDQFQAVDGTRFIFRTRSDLHFEGFYESSRLWESDGTAAGTRAVTDAYPDEVLAAHGGYLFVDDSGLWGSDGSGGASLLLPSSNLDGRPSKLTAANGEVYFERGIELWRSNGSASGTVMVTGGVYIVSMAELNGRLYFSAYDSSQPGSFFTNTLSLRTTDGTDAGTRIIKPKLRLRESVGHTPNDIFVGSIEGRRGQIWRTDGTEVGTRPLTRFDGRSGLLSLQDLLLTDDRLFMSVDDNVHGKELWVLDLDSSDPLPGSGRIGDRVWWDLNGDGVQDDGEPGMADVLIDLEDCAGNVLNTTVSDDRGAYQFARLAAGEYRLRFIAPTGYGFSPRFAAGDYTRDSNAHPSTGLDTCMSLSAGQERLARDAGLIKEGGGQLGDRVWRDVNGNGVQDVDEPGFSGVQVQLEDCDGNLLNSTTTDGSGTFGFDGLSAGDYQLRFIAPAGYRFSPPAAAGDYNADSNPNPATGLDRCRPLAEGQSRLGLDAGLIRQ